MEYFKTVGGMLSSTFAGEKDDKGNEIKPIEKPMNKKEYLKYKAEEIQNKINKTLGSTRLHSRSG